MCHVAHDCRLGNHLIMANAASLAGHITIGDHAIIGGLDRHPSVCAHRRLFDGRRLLRVGQDLPPFMWAAGGYRAQHVWPEFRRLCSGTGFQANGSPSLKHAFDLLFRSGHRTAEAIELAKEEFKDQADV